MRRELAGRFEVPAYIIFGDAALQEMARVRPVNLEAFRTVKGVGERKAADFGDRFTAEIAEYCRTNGLSTNNSSVPGRRAGKASAAGRGSLRARSFEMFAQGRSVEDVASQMGLSPATIAGHLARYIEERKPADISAWIDPATYELITSAARKLNADRLKPVFDHLAGLVPYDKIRITLTHVMGSRVGED